MATCICIACRTLYEEGQKCPGGKQHRTIDLAESRHELDDEVWGPDSRARELRKVAKAGTGGATAGGFLDACGSLGDCGAIADCSGGAGEAIVAIIGVIIAAVVIGLVVSVLYWLIKNLIAFLREKAHRPKPHGALLAAPRVGKRAVSGRGVIRKSRSLALPWKAGVAAAYALELHGKAVFGGGAMLRDARGAGFEIALDDGRVVLVPAGRLRLLGDSIRESVDDEKIDALVRELDPHRAEARTLFPHDFARTLVLAEGDRVEVLGDLEASAEARAGYREAVLAPKGTPVLRVVRSFDPKVRIDLSAAPGPAAAEESPEEEEEEGAAAPKTQRVRP